LYRYHLDAWNSALTEAHNQEDKELVRLAKTHLSQFQNLISGLEAFNTQPVICVDPLNTKNAGDKLIGNSVVESPTSIERESILRLEEMVETLLFLGEQESTMLNTELQRENQDLKTILSQLQLAQSSIDIRMTTGSHSWTGDEAAESPSSPLLQSHRRYRTKSGLKIPGVDKDPNLE
jgi:hypothetical protein